MKLSVVVLTFDRWKELLPDCITSIDSQKLPEGTEKLIVDNGTYDWVEPIEGWYVRHLRRNVGGIQGQNMCFALAEGTHVLFVSDDVRFEECAIEKLLAYAHYDGQVAPVILWPDRSVQAIGGRVEGGKGINNTSWPKRVDYIPSITYLMSKEIWADVGGFDARLPGAYEDVEMGKVLGPNRLYIHHKAFAIHLGNATLRYGWRDKWRFWKARRMMAPCKP